MMIIRGPQLFATIIVAGWLLLFVGGGLAQASSTQQLLITIVFNGDSALYVEADGASAVGKCLELTPIEDTVAGKGTTPLAGDQAFEASFEVILPWGSAGQYESISDVESRFHYDVNNPDQSELRALDWKWDEPVVVVDPAAEPTTLPTTTTTQAPTQAAPTVASTEAPPTLPLTTTPAPALMVGSATTTLATEEYHINTTWKQTDKFFKDNTDQFVTAIATALNVQLQHVVDKGPQSSTLGPEYIWVTFEVDVEEGGSLDDTTGEDLYEKLYAMHYYRGEPQNIPGHLSSLLTLKFQPLFLSVKHTATGAVYSGVQVTTPTLTTTMTSVPTSMVTTTVPGSSDVGSLMTTAAQGSENAMRVFTTRQSLTAAMTMLEAEAQRNQIRLDIARSCCVPDENVTIVSIEPGSVVVTFEVTTNTDVNANDEIVRDAVKNQTGEGGNLANYSVQTVTVIVTVYQDQETVIVYKEDWVAVTLVVVVGVLLVIMIVVVSVLVVMMLGKKKQRSGKNCRSSDSGSLEDGVGKIDNGEDEALFKSRASPGESPSVNAPLTPRQQHLNSVQEQQQQQLILMQQMIQNQQAQVMINQQQQKGPQPGILVTGSTQKEFPCHSPPSRDKSSNETTSDINSPSSKELPETQQPSSQLLFIS